MGIARERSGACISHHARASDGCRLAWRRDGTPGAPPLLLCNSIGTASGLWDAQLTAFAERFDVIRFDMRGHGGSDAPPGPYALPMLAGDALSVLDAAGVERAHVCGLSLGGAVALRLALDASERLDRLVVANSSARIGTAEAWQARIDTVLSDGLEAVAEMAMSRFFDAGFRDANSATIDRFRTMFLANAPHGYAGCCAALRDADLRPVVAAIRSPTLVIAGRSDVSTPPAQLRALADALPDARFVELDAAHLSNVEAPHAFARAAVAFLSTGSTSPADLENAGRVEAGDRGHSGQPGRRDRGADA